MSETARRREPIINAPTGILVIIALLTAIHAYREFLLDRLEDYDFILRYSFIPLRYDFEGRQSAYGEVPGSDPADIWTFFTYSLLHGDWLHLTVNALWLLIFGSALLRRFGMLRFILLSAIGSVGGALLHLVSFWGELVPMVGASAAISAHMGATVRFAFVPYGPLGRPRSTHPGAYFLPALSIREVVSNSNAMAFLVVYLAINLLTGIGATSFLGEGEAQIAWQAHIGGFLIGFLAFPLMDPARNLTRP